MVSSSPFFLLSISEAKTNRRFCFPIGWRNESYSIYGPPVDGAGPLPGSNTAFTLERSACSLFGVATYGVHCTGKSTLSIILEEYS